MMDNSTLDFASTLREARDMETIWQTVEAHFSASGFDVVNWGSFDLVTQSPIGMYTNMSEDWMSYYLDQNYMDCDPWFKELATGGGHIEFTQDRLEQLFPRRSAKVNQLFNEVRDVGICSSLFIPFDSGTSERSGFHLASTKDNQRFRAMTNEKMGEIAVTSAIANCFLTPPHNRTKPNNSWYNNGTQQFSLSDRECEVLQRLAHGFNNDGIAEKLSITGATVNFHLGSIKRKLGARTREQALAIAIIKGLIKP